MQVLLAARGINARRSRGPWDGLQPLCQPWVTFGHFAILQVRHIMSSAPLCFKLTQGLEQLIVFI